MNILHVTPSFYPATYWGGPIWSTKAICDGIAARTDMNLRVLTTDAAGPRVGDRVVPADLPYQVDYARRLAGHSIAPGLLARLPAALAWADVVHLTGAYSMPSLPTLLLAKLMGKPVVWSPRGSLQATASWDGAPRRRLKHAIERLAQICRPTRSVLHVTAMSEGAESTRRLAGIQLAMITNAVEIPVIDKRPEPGPDCVRLLYLGRLHEKKGLDLLLEAMKALPGNVHLDIYGTGDPAYVARLSAAASEYDGRVTLHGHVDGAAKHQAFANADLFVLPSHSENFGIVVAEALAHGLPVLTTTGTPWAALDARGCGRCIDLVQDDLVTEIKALAKADLPAMGARGRDWMARDFSPAAMVDAFAALYREVATTPGQAVPA